MFVVTGSTGHVGGAVVRALRAQGKPVRALLRNEERAGALAALGAETFLASVEDAAKLEVGFEGAEAVFVMTPPLLKAPDMRMEHSLALAAIKHALQASHVPKVVFLSSVGAQHAEGTGAILKLYDMEQELFELPIDAVAIRAAFFMENFAALYPMAKESGKLPVTIEPVDRALPMIATEDIGKLAAELLVEQWSGHRTIELEGPRQYSMQDAATIFGQLLNRTVEPALVAAGDRKAMYESLGMPEGAAEAMAEMAEGFSSGHIAFVGGEGIEHRQGTTTLEEVYQDH